MPVLIIQRSADRAAKTRRRISASFARFHNGIEQPARTSQQQFWRHLTKTVVERFEQIGTVSVDVDELFSAAEFRDAFNRSLLRHWNAGVFTGAEFESDWVNLNRPEQQSIAGLNAIRQDIDVNNPAPPPSIDVEMSPQLQGKVREFLKARQVGVWNRVARTTHDRIRRTLSAGLRDGDDLRAMQKRVQSVLKSYGQMQARRVARTETTGSMNFGQQIEREELDIADKEWVSTIDSRTRGVKPKDRFNHLSADGQVVANAEAFDVSGEPLRFPGDSEHGSAGNIIHCRCTSVAAFEPKKRRRVPKKGKAKFRRARKRKNPMPKRTEPPASASVQDRAQFEWLRGMDTEQRTQQTADRINLYRERIAEHKESLEDIRKKVAKLKDPARIGNRIKKLGDEIISSTKEILKEMDPAKRNILIERRDKIRKTIKELRENKVAAEAEARSQVVKILAHDDTVEMSYRLVGRSHTPQSQSRADDAVQFYNRVLSKKHGKTGGKIDVKINVQKKPRAFYEDNGKVFVHQSSDVRTYVHEIGHAIEDIGHADVAKLARGFLHHRGGVEKAYAFNKKFAGRGYKWYEVGIDDKFAKAFGDSAHYVGKYYKKATYQDATEIISMGIEKLFAEPVKFAKADPEFFRFIVGIVRGNLLP